MNQIIPPESAPLSIEQMLDSIRERKEALEGRLANVKALAVKAREEAKEINAELDTLNRMLNSITPRTRKPRKEAAPKTARTTGVDAPDA